MKDLASLQALLAEIVRGATTIEAEHAAAIATGNARLSAHAQIDLYREQFFFRHVDVLRDDFKAIERLLGAKRFADIAHAYLAAVPPASFTLRDLGHGFASFLASHLPDDPLVAEVARVEWAFVEAFDGPDLAPFDPASIAGVSEERWPLARLVLDPTLQRIALDYPAHDVRIDARKDDAAPVRPLPKRSFVVIGRGPEALTAWEVGADAFALLDELARGASLGDACERAANVSGIPLDVFQPKLAGWFSEWTARGWIRRVVF